MEFPDSCIRVTDLPGGIGLTSDGLSAIRSVLLEPRTVITVENLTTYHDIPSDDRAVLYLGGFPNSARASFLRMVYASKPDAVYLHYGDLDPYGLLINRNSICRFRNGSCYPASLFPGRTLPSADRRRSESHAVTYALCLPGNICLHAGT